MFSKKLNIELCKLQQIKCKSCLATQKYKTRLEYKTELRLLNSIISDLKEINNNLITENLEYKKVNQQLKEILKDKK